MKLLKFLLVTVISVGVIVLTLQFFKNNETMSLIFKTMNITQSAVDKAAQNASQAAADAVAKAASKLQSTGDAIHLSVTSQPASKADDSAPTASSIPRNGSDWGSTGMQGLTVYEYGKTLLRSEQQGVYEGIAAAVEKMDNQFVVKTSLKPAEVEAAYQYYLYDHSEVFYLKDTNMQYSYTGSGSSVVYQSYTFQFTYRYDKAAVSNMRSEIRSAALQMLKSASSGGDLSEERALHDLIVRNVSYDSGAAQNPDSSPESFTAYGALVNKKAVCDGYARATKILLSSAGIKTLYLTGSAKGSGGWESHGWNMADIGGKWYYLDTTFDDPVFINSSGKVINTDNTVSHKYFNFISKDDHRLGLFNSDNPFDANSENYVSMPVAG